MKIIKKYLLPQKGDGFVINFFKICLWLPTAYYLFYSVSVVINLIDRWLNGPNPLPMSINPETLWLYYSAAYLVLCAVHVAILKLARSIRKK